MDKCYEGIYVKNIDTLKPKVDYMNKLAAQYFKVIGVQYPNVANATKNLV